MPSIIPSFPQNRVINPKANLPMDPQWIAWFNALTGGVNNISGSSISVKLFGAKMDGVTDDAPAIQALINFLATIGGGTAVFPASPTTCNIGSTLNINSSDIKLAGAGHGGFHDTGTLEVAATILKWVGSSGGTMVSIQPTGTATQNLKGCGVTGIYFNPGSPAAAIAVLANSSNQGVYDIAGDEFTTALMQMGALTTLSETSDPQGNEVSLSARNILTSGSCLICGGTSTANTSFNIFKRISAQYKAGICVWLQNADNNVFVSIQLFRAAGGTAPGILCDAGSAINTVARANLFIDCSPGSGGFYGAGTERGVVPSTNNHILYYDTENGPPAPAPGTSATILWASNHAAIGYRASTLAVGATQRTETRSDGFIRQGAQSAAVGAGGTLVVTFTTPFTTGISTIFLTPTSNNPGFVTAASTTSFTINNAGAAPATYYWVAEGF